MLLFSIVAYVAFGCFCLWCIISGVRKMKEIRSYQESPDYYSDEKEHDEAMKAAEAFEKGYFERIRNGEQSQQFLSVGSMTVCSILRSLLAADGIPTYTENEHVNRMYSLNTLPGNSAFSIKVFILIADYDRAYDIVSNYISSNEKKDEKTPSIKEAAETDARAVVTGLFFINLPDGAEEHIHGITILPRIN